MSAMRVALITRRFWPLVGGAESVMANLATEMRRQRHQVQVVTAQWNPNWPTDFVHREIDVHRLANPAQRGWGTYRYMAHLGTTSMCTARLIIHGGAAFSAICAESGSSS